MMSLNNFQIVPSTPTTTTIAVTTSTTTSTNMSSIQNSNVTSTTESPPSATPTFSRFPNYECQNNNSTAASTSAASSGQFQLDATLTARSSTGATLQVQGRTFAAPTRSLAYLANTQQPIAQTPSTQQSNASTSSGHFSGASMAIAGPSNLQKLSGFSANMSIAGPSSAPSMAIAGPSSSSSIRPVPGKYANRLARLLKRKKVEVPNTRTLHIPLLTINSVTAMPPLPPNWNENMGLAFESLASYKLFQISSLTSEFRRLSELVSPLVVEQIEQIVNPAVWTRFVNMRKEMLTAKCNDTILLKELGLTDIDIARQQQLLNFTRHNAIDAAPYNENFLLLLHCTRDPANVEKILRDGFDERMGQGGSLGRGIYFTDKPLMSITYDGCGGVMFICGVLLGDCLTYRRDTLSTIYSNQGSVKEPEKFLGEKRFINDNYFDSVCAATNFNQYAVYNRYQCCPLYKVKYSQEYADAQQVDASPFSTPRFGWLSATETNFSEIAAASTLPLHAETVFDEMERMQGLGPIAIHSTTPSQELIDGNLKLLNNLGYTDIELNLKTLRENDYDVSRCVRVLLKRNDINNALKARLADAFKPTALPPPAEDKAVSVSEGSSYHSSTDEDAPKERPPKERQRKLTKKSTPAEPLEEDCPICCEKYAKMSDHWRMLQCKHKLCVTCFQKIEVTRTTMTGSSHTFIKCPFCNITAGIEIGICPNGEMSDRVIPSHCDGYEGSNTILIEYKVKNGTHLVRRVAFLPDNEEGRNMLKLLRIAWDRRIIFTVGTSHTTGIENAVVWNIHHKTSQRGGVSRYGFPDPTYFVRVTTELKGFGI